MRKKYKVLYDKEKLEREKLADLNERLSAKFEERMRELAETHRKLQGAYAELSQELDMARNIQAGLLPREFPDIANVALTATYVPAGTVGGDLYDIIKTPSGKVAILIFDVSGHGVPAALIGTMAKMLFAQYIEKFDSPAQVFANVNRHICSVNKTDHYLTAFLGVLDPVTNTLVYSRAAHVPPIVCRAANRSVIPFKGKGLFIGHAALVDIAAYRDETIVLEDGDKVLFYTDGLTEAANREERMYGSERLLASVQEHAGLGVDEFVAAILRDHTDFVAGSPLRDDFTLLGIELGRPRARMSQTPATSPAASHHGPF